MIAQPILTTAPTAKPQAQQHQQQGQQQQQTQNGFQSLLSTTDSSLTDLIQNTGASAAPSQPANGNKQKNNDPTAIPYVAVPNQPSPTPALPSDVKQALSSQAPLSANGVPNNAVVPASDPSATATDQGNNGNNNNGNNNGNSTGFGANELNARIVAGAPIYASQPNAAMATVPAHLLDAANTHPLPGETVGKPGEDANAKAPTDANTASAPASANAAAPTAQLLPSHPTVNAPAASSNNPNDNGGTPAQTADNSTAATSSNDPNAQGTSLLAQPTAPQTAPVQVDAAVHTAAPYVPIGEQVALNLRQAIVANNNEIRIQLKPASLGTIDVKLNVGQDGRVNAVISADRSDTLNMLKQDSGTLQQALRDAGLNADSNSLNFNLRGDAQSFAQNWSQGGGGNSGGGASYRSGASDVLLRADTITSAQRYHSGALDIEV